MYGEILDKLDLFANVSVEKVIWPLYAVIFSDQNCLQTAHFVKKTLRSRQDSMVFWIFVRFSEDKNKNFVILSLRISSILINPSPSLNFVQEQ